MKNTLWIIPLALALTACSPTATEPEVSADCTTAMTELEQVPMDDFEAEDAAVTKTTQACTTAKEYIAAVKANPAAWAYASADKIQEELLLMSACLQNAEQPMCTDAQTQGLLN